jgi:hypothetical protein
MEFSSFRNAIGMATAGQYHPERGVPLIDPLEQIVQSQGQGDKTGLTDELARDAEAKKRLAGRDVAARRRSVSVDDQPAGDIHSMAKKPGMEKTYSKPANRPGLRVELMFVPLL